MDDRWMTYVDYRVQQEVLSKPGRKTRTVRRFAWFPTLIFNDFACAYGRYEWVWLTHYSCFQEWGIIGSLTADIYAEPVWGWITIEKYKV